MNPLARKVLGLTCVVALCAGNSWAADLQNLVDRSPFAPPGHSGDSSAPQEQAALEFRGMVTDQAGTSYSVYDTTSNKGRWVRADDANSPIRVRGFDAASNTLEIEQNGRQMKLPLKRAVIQAGQPVTAMIPATPAPIMNPVPSAPGEMRAKPESGADARRLEAVAAEVRRRRALRNAATGTRQGQPAPGAPAPGQSPSP